MRLRDQDDRHPHGGDDAAITDIFETKNTATSKARSSRPVVVTCRRVNFGGNSEAAKRQVRRGSFKFENRAIQQGPGVNEVRALSKGIKDVRPVEITLPGADVPMVVGLRALTAWEESDITAKAMAFAKAKGVDKPDERDYQFVLGCWANTLLPRAAFEDLSIDVGGGDPVTFKKGEPMFANVDEILQGLDRDRISYLYEMQQRIQEDHGLRKERLSQEEMLAAVAQIATSEVGDANLPFWRWGRVCVRASCILASMLYFHTRTNRPLVRPPKAENDSPTKKPE